MFLKSKPKIFHHFRLSYLPSMIIFFASGISGLTGIVEYFFVKNQLNLSPAFLASLAFWISIPWAFKMPIGHLVDLFWPRKNWFIYLGATIMLLSLLTMVGLTGNLPSMTRFATADAWYVIASLLAPIGFVIQNVVAEAMTVEAVPLVDSNEKKYSSAELNQMHITMQTYGRAAIIAGGALVAGLGGWLVGILSYADIYKIALTFPFISVSGIFLENWLRKRNEFPPIRAKAVRPDWKLLILSAAFIIFSITIGLSSLNFGELLVFLVSLAVFTYLIGDILRSVSREKRRQIIAIAIIIFIFRATPSFGTGAGWWQIDVLHFDEHFFGTLSQVSALAAILGTLLLRDWMARHSVSYFIIFLTVINTILLLPFIGLYFGLGQWTMTHFGFGAKALALVDTAAESPLGQVAIIPMLAWIAKEAPRRLTATYFSVFTAFSNLALSASSLSTQYINQLFRIQRENYAPLGQLMIWVTLINFFLPILAVILLHPKQKPASFE